jgi:hypothetical protein
MAIKAKVGKSVLAIQEQGVGSCKDALLFGTSADVYGAGFVNVVVGVTVDHFAEIAEAMMAANPDEAVKAFGRAIKDGIAEPRELRPLPPLGDGGLHEAFEVATRKRAEALARMRG